MTVNAFDLWPASMAHVYPISSLAGVVLGIEAAHYLNEKLSGPSTQERLLAAHGGAPLALQRIVENDLDRFHDLGIKPIFVFSGMDEIVRKDSALGPALSAASMNEEAWSLYDSKQGLAASHAFATYGAITPNDLFRFLQKILRNRKVDFMVAPYNACAQLGYLENHQTQYIDTIWASQEAFLFNTDRIITKIDLENGQFHWISRLACQESLGKLPTDMFVDVCMLSGSSFLPTFPPVAAQKSDILRDITNMMNTLGRSVTSLCAHYQDEGGIQRMNYLDKYRRGRMAVKHHIILTSDGMLMPLDLENAPADFHEFIGRRLPDELYFYLSKGTIGPRVMNWLASGEIIEIPPLEGGPSPVYQTLVRDMLAPLRSEALSLLSQGIHRYFHRKEAKVAVKSWFEADRVEILDYKALVPTPYERVSAWNVKESSFKPLESKFKSAPGTLSFAISALSDTSFASTTITPKGSTSPLSSKAEIVANVLWRFLQIRGYVDDKHNLTPWGKVFQSVASSLGPGEGLDEAAFLIVELLRLNLLTTENIFPQLSGIPERESGQILWRCRSKGIFAYWKLHHAAVGYAGPLNRNLLAYNSLISTIRNTLRDLIEVILASMLINSDVDRSGGQRSDWTDLGLDLPFLTDNDCGLGLATFTYLEAIAFDCSDAAKSQARHSKAIKNALSLSSDLDSAFSLWDAAYSGLKTRNEVIEGFDDIDKWHELNNWVTAMR
ncbi:MAG: hypothetical protein M1829_005630 [Trizodia sp. TS-e1964]|nr:MAG: hypothetical protein M1829_005630 [Trizodia sp. TS-e1964]